MVKLKTAQTQRHKPHTLSHGELREELPLFVLEIRRLPGHEILKTMPTSLPYIPRPQLTPHLRPGFLIEWMEDETGTRHFAIIVTVHVHEITDPHSHWCDVVSPGGRAVFVRQIIRVHAVLHHPSIVARARST